MSAPFNYYDILGIQEGASPEEIRIAYRKLAMQYHPDRNPSPDAHKQFVAINAAHETLSDPIKRRLYDLRRQVGLVIPGGTRTSGPGPEGGISAEEMRRRFWASPAGQRKRRELEREAGFFSTISLIFRIISVPVMLFMFMLVLDGLFPKEYVNQKVSYVEERIRGQGNTAKVEHKFKLGEHEAWVRSRFKHCLVEGESVDLKKGRIFGIVTSVKFKEMCTFAKKKGLFGQAKEKQELDPAMSLFSGTGSLVYLVLILFGIVWWARKNGPVVAGLGLISTLMAIVVFLLFLNLLP